MNKNYNLLFKITICLLIAFTSTTSVNVLATNIIETPELTLSEDDLVYSTTTYTNQNVTVTLDLKGFANVTNGTNVHVFKENGVHEFNYETGTGYKGTVTAKVDYIDKTSPIVEVTYEEVTGTGNVIATLSCADKEIKALNHDSLSYTFYVNGTFDFEYTDLYGNTGSVLVEATNIDRVVPEVELDYNIKEETTDNVIVTLVNPSESIIVTNNDGLESYTFTQNGSFTFVFKDLSGNTNTITATVDWIKTPIVENESLDDSVNTGDDTSIMLYLVLGGLSGFLVVFLKNKKKD